jgi:hypothetical protein
VRGCYCYCRQLCDLRRYCKLLTFNSATLQPRSCRSCAALLMRTLLNMNSLQYQRKLHIFT